MKRTWHNVLKCMLQKLGIALNKFISVINSNHFTICYLCIMSKDFKQQQLSNTEWIFFFFVQTMFFHKNSIWSSAWYLFLGFIQRKLPHNYSRLHICSWSYNPSSCIAVFVATIDDHVVKLLHQWINSW